MILVIDNYDSFTYNLVQLLESAYSNIKIVKNDEMTIEEIRTLNPKGILLSPGPSTPDNAGICLDIVKQLYTEIPIMGVCLGHQTIAQAFGCNIIKANQIIHGKTDRIIHDGQGLYHNILRDFTGTRYHSLIVDRDNISDDLIVSSTNHDNSIIMGIRHKNYPVEGVQFHPESYKTEFGQVIINNFLKLSKVV